MYITSDKFIKMQYIIKYNTNTILIKIVNYNIEKNIQSTYAFNRIESAAESFRIFIIRGSKMQLQIKEFAEVANVSVRALHLYDKIGLFQPVFIDEKNHYRYYDTEQMLELNTIMSFKRVGFKLNEIKEMKAANLSKQEVIKRLKDKQQENEKQMSIARYNIENIKQMLKGLEELEGKANLETEEDIEAEALRVSEISCLENDKLEHDFSKIIWL